MAKRVLLLGGTGAMGVYLAPELVKLGYKVDITSRSDHKSSDKNTAFIKGNARDEAFLRKVFAGQKKEKYDAIVDFMIYKTDEFKERHALLLDSCKQYVFLSSYRVFADDKVITEKSPRLLDVLKDEEYLATDEYALAKARQEDILRASGRKNWTIVRPSITYSRERFQFGTVEADVVVWRALRGLPVTLPREIADKQATMTWAGDAARLIAKLIMNKKAFAEDFNVTTSEHHTWTEIGDIYGDIIGLKVKLVSVDEHIKAAGYADVKYLINYNRMYDRVLDNAKVLRVTGEKQEGFASLRDGLRRELTWFKKHPHFKGIDYAKHARIDRLTHAMPDLRSIPRQYLKIYLANRFPALVPLATAVRRVRAKLRPRTRIRGLVMPYEKLRSKFISYRNIAHLRRINSNPDGAILTLIDYANYGNLLQRFALQRFLDKNGYRFTSYEHALPKGSDVSDARFANIADFVRRYIARKEFKGKDDLPAYITGSDQVWRNWNYADESRDLGFFFCNFVQDPKKRRIAYAASFGKDSAKAADISREFIKQIGPYVKNMSAIGVREESGAEVVQKEWGVKADVVIDPTLLLGPGDYNQIIQESADRKAATSGVFTYLFGSNENNAKLAADTAQSMGEPMYSVRPYGRKAQSELPSVAYWLKSIRDAKLVITESFHCTVFAILNNTPFIVIENEHGGVARVTNLLTQFGIEDRLVAVDQVSSFDVTKLKPIDWQAVNKKLDELRKDSSEWLLAALKRPL